MGLVLAAACPQRIEFAASEHPSQAVRTGLAVSAVHPLHPEIGDAVPTACGIDQVASRKGDAVINEAVDHGTSRQGLPRSVAFGRPLVFSACRARGALTGCQHQIAGFRCGQTSEKRVDRRVLGPDAPIAVRQFDAGPHAVFVLEGTFELAQRCPRQDAGIDQDKTARLSLHRRIKPLAPHGLRAVDRPEDRWKRLGRCGPVHHAHSPNARSANQPRLLVWSGVEPRSGIVPITSAKTASGMKSSPAPTGAYCTAAGAG